MVDAEDEAYLTTGPVEFRFLEIWGMSGMNDPDTKTVAQSSDYESQGWGDQSARGRVPVQDTNANMNFFRRGENRS
jgi:hypothetical protein